LMHDSAVDPHASHDQPWRIPAPAHGAVALLILGVTCASLHFFYTRGLSNLYGDGLAHMEGARRIFDSITPGYEEIGSVWLPLYHLICAPLAINDFLWRTGLAGGLVSSTAFALTCYLLFRLGAEINRNLVAGLVALAGALLCPSFLYLASTPLTEPLALMWSVLVAYALFRYSQSGSWNSLAGAAVAAFMATLTRYEGWNILPFATMLVFLIYPCPWRQRLSRALVFAGIAGTGPLLWLIQNAYRFRNPLEFYNGLGSAKDIYAHQLATTAFPYPTDGSLLLSARYYLEDLKLVIGVWALELAVLGLVAWCASLRESRRGAVAVLFLIPLPFYIQAMAHAAIPLVCAHAFPLCVLQPAVWGGDDCRGRTISVVYIFPALGKGPPRNPIDHFFWLCWGGSLRRPLRRSPGTAGGKGRNPEYPCRAQRQRAIIDFLRRNTMGSASWWQSGKWPCVMPEADIYFCNTLTNLTRQYWARMKTEPQKWVEWIIRGDGDAIDSLMQAYPQAFTNYKVVDQGAFQGEGSFKIYRLRKM
jgi:hypothetical protein